MPLRGELNSVDLAHVFQMLVLNQKAGALEIHHEGVRRGLYFSAQGVSVPFERDLLIKRAVRALVRSGEVTSEQVERARHNMAVLELDCLHTLVEMRAISNDRRIQCLRAQLEEDVYELFFIPDATFEFRDGDTESLAGEVDPDLILSPNGIIMEAARRVDEWEFIRRLVPSGTDIVEVVGQLDLIEDRARTSDLEAVVGYIDGILTIDDIISRSGMSRFVVLRNIAMMLEAGIIGSVPVESLVLRADEKLASGDPGSASKLFERAIASGADSLPILVGAGEAYVSLGRNKEAAGRFMAAGRRAEDDGDLGEAVGLYHRIQDLLPSHVDARERLFALHKAARGDLRKSYKPEVEGWALASILSELNRPDALIAVVTGLMELAGNDPGQIENLADRASKLGLSTFGVDAYCLAAELHKARKDPKSAVAALRRAQGIDPSRSDLKARIQSFGVDVAKARARRRSFVRGMSMAACFALLFIGYGRFSQAALVSFGEWSVEDFVANGRFDEGREHYSSIIRRYPCTIPFLLSFEKIRELDVAERHAKDVDRFRAEVDSDTRESRIRQAESLREGALAARHTGDWTQAAALLRKARDLTPDEDPLDLDDSLGELEAYLAEARRLKSEALFYRNAGRFAEAHARLVKLTSNYAHSEAGRNVLVPVLIESDVTATIYRDGQPLRLMDGISNVVAETPFVLDLAPDADVEIELRADGYVPATVRVSPLLQATLRVDLPKPTELHAILPHRIIAPPVAAGSLVAVAMERGRVAALDATRLTVRWIESLPRMAEVVGSPWITGGEIMVVTSQGEIVAIRGRGDVRVVGELPGRAAGGAVVSAGSLCIALEGGALAIGPLGSLVRVDVPAGLRSGPLPLLDGRFVVGSEDGRVWVVGASGSLSALPGRVGSSPVSAMAVSGDRVFLGSVDGRLSVHDLGGGLVTERATVEGPVVGICGDDRFPVIAGNSELVTVDLLEEESVKRRAGQFHISQAPQSDWVIAARPSDGLIFSMSRRDLSTDMVHAAEGGPLLPGTFVGQRVYHATAAGKVVGILYPRR